MSSDPLERSHTAPKFAAPDPGALATWYVEHLGFPDHAIYEDAGYAIVRRGALTLHFWSCAERRIAENTACYTELESVESLDALHTEWLDRAGRPGFHPGRIQKTPIDAPGHGMREFHTWDPAGNLIGFGAALNKD